MVGGFVGVSDGMGRKSNADGSIRLRGRITAIIQAAKTKGMDVALIGRVKVETEDGTVVECASYNPELRTGSAVWVSKSCSSGSFYVSCAEIVH